MSIIRKFVPVIVLTSLLLAACGGTVPDSQAGLKVVASTTIVGDVVAQVGGGLVELTILFPTGTDPHTFEPRPQDMAALNQADLVILNGLGLEETLEPALEANAKGTIVHASEGIEVLAFEGKEHEGEEHEGEGHHHEGGDPHTWMDPNNVIVWTENIVAALSEADPANAADYRANADTYIESLRELDSWIRAEVEKISLERRKLVTDHLSYGYFADEYGFEQVGALIKAFSTNAAPSAQELAALQDEIREQNVVAVFVGKTVNPELAAQVARDTGTKLVYLYHGSLSEPGGEADSYLKFMRYNVNAIVEALK